MAARWRAAALKLVHPAGGNYCIQQAGCFRLQNGHVATVEQRPCLVVSDLDDTMVRLGPTATPCSRWHIADSAVRTSPGAAWPASRHEFPTPISTFPGAQVGDDAASAAFRAWWEAEAVPRGGRLCYNTGRDWCAAPPTPFPRPHGTKLLGAARSCTPLPEQGLLAPSSRRLTGGLP